MAKLSIPEVNEIITEAILNITKRYGVSNLRELLMMKNFSDTINELEEEANKVYKKYERKAIMKYLKQRQLLNKDVITVIDAIINNSLLTSIANTRRARAGVTTERILILLLRSSGVECEEASIEYEGYKPDIIIPSNSVFGDYSKPNLDKIFVLAVKRTLRERWSEDIRIFRFPNSAFILIKPDPDFTPQKAEDMAKSGMKRIYIPDSLYNMYKDYLNILKRRYEVVFKPLSDLTKDLLEFQRKIGLS
jgi:hypothetical protein